MPFNVAPETAEDRLFVYDETVSFVNKEKLAGRPSPIKEATLTGVTAFIGIFEPLVRDLTQALGVRSQEVSEATVARKFCEDTVRDYIEVLKRRTRRKGHEAAVLVNHGLPENGDTPELNSWSEVKQMAEALLAGDGLSTAKYGAMANPSAEELATALAAAEKEHGEVAPADSAVQAAQNALRAQSEQAAFWVSEVRYDALDFARREDDPGQRRLLRKLGYKFKTLPGEVPEDTTDAAAVAPVV
jgi:hypothetical protein